MDYLCGCLVYFDEAGFSQAHLLNQVHPNPNPNLKQVTSDFGSNDSARIEYLKSTLCPKPRGNGKG